MRIRDEQLREELRWREKTQAIENKRKEENLEALLQQRDEEWKEELALRNRALKANLRKKGKGFYS